MRLRPLGHEDRVRVWEVCSALLRYPDEELVAALPQIGAAARGLRIPQGDAIAALCDRWSAAELTELQSRYVDRFDLGRACSLYLSWHQYGDRRQRGMVLLKLKRRFAEHGLAPATPELPDWLPLLLEFAATAPDPVGRDLLTDWRAAIELIRRSLRERGEEHLVVFDALAETLGRSGTDVERLVERLLKDGPPDEEVGLNPFGPDSETWEQMPPSGYDNGAIAVGGPAA